eukprot:CAMPEP_0118843108 /NCGR_PEP_ID=MMETSP1162-20130426/81550_1 /TAXON_ID=33656 /ORGANISM="Phaeocystis Sp, Strain CCMP2710" /LENGTH=166 /DNA_ID=CAMNT_0006775201 /DNA_START=194 /DNA_END=692 /DNA_ORIENTATION=-
MARSQVEGELGEVGEGEHLREVLELQPLRVLGHEGGDDLLQRVVGVAPGAHEAEDVEHLVGRDAPVAVDVVQREGELQLLVERRLGGERREGAAELAEGERARLVLVVAGDHAAQQRVHRHLAHRAHLVGIDQPVAVAVEVAEALREDHYSEALKCVLDASSAITA